VGGNKEEETWVYTLRVDDRRGQCRGGNGVELPVVLVLLDAALLRSSLYFCPPLFSLLGVDVGSLVGH